MKDYYVIINFEYNDASLKSKGNFSVDHIFYNQPDEVNDDLANYWLSYMTKLLYNLYNTKTFNPVLKNGKFDIYTLPDDDDKNPTRIDRNHRLWQDERNRKALEFHAKMFKQENDFVSINEDLLDMRSKIPDFKPIDSYFNKVEF
jgi:hypothetical protein